MNRNRTKIISRISKLRALAEGNAETMEAAVAAEMADKLMREHAISQMDLDEEAILAADPIGSAGINISRATWTAQLAWALGKHCRVSVLRVRRYKDGRRRYRAEAWGHVSDLEIWTYLYEVAKREIEARARQYKASCVWVDRTSMSQFREGAVRGLALKLREMRGEAAATASAGTELVLQDRAARARAARQAANPGGTRVYKGGVGASSAGIEAGKQIDLKPGLTSAARRGQKKLR